MTMRLSIISFAGMVRTLVAVGIVSEASMLVASAFAMPRSGVTTSSFAAPDCTRWRGRVGGDRLRRRRGGFVAGATGCSVRARGCAPPMPARPGAGSGAAATAAASAGCAGRRGGGGRPSAWRPDRQSGAGCARAARRGAPAGSRGRRRRVAAASSWGCSTAVRLDRVVALEHRPPGLVDRVLVGDGTARRARPRATRWLRTRSRRRPRFPLTEFRHACWFDTESSPTSSRSLHSQPSRLRPLGRARGRDGYRFRMRFLSAPPAYDLTYSDVFLVPVAVGRVEPARRLARAGRRHRRDHPDRVREHELGDGTAARRDARPARRSRRCCRRTCPCRDLDDGDRVGEGAVVALRLAVRALGRRRPRGDAQRSLAGGRGPRRGARRRGTARYLGVVAPPRIRAPRPDARLGDLAARRADLARRRRRRRPARAVRRAGRGRPRVRAGARRTGALVGTVSRRSAVAAGRLHAGARRARAGCASPPRVGINGDVAGKAKALAELGRRRAGARHRARPPGGDAARHRGGRGARPRACRSSPGTS